MAHTWLDLTALVAASADSGVREAAQSAQVAVSMMCLMVSPMIAMVLLYPFPGGLCTDSADEAADDPADRSQERQGDRADDEGRRCELFVEVHGPTVLLSSSTLHRPQRVRTKAT